MHTEQKTKDGGISRGLTILLAAACGLIVANLYYAQTLVGPIGASTGLSAGAAGLIVTLTQIGYVAGLLFIVPLADIVENRRLTVVALAAATAALIAAALAPNAPLFLAASLLIGTASVVAQVLVPFAASLASEEQRGRAVGNVMSGLLLGIMLARPVASFIAGIWSWPAVFAASAVAIALLAVLLSRKLPERRPVPSVSYGKLIRSLVPLLARTPTLRRRALYQSFLFGAFSLFWTVAPLRLADAYGMSQQGIAWFALVGVGGAVAAPIAGRLADKGWSRPLTWLALSVALLSWLLPQIFHGHSTASLVLLFVSAIALDMAVSGNLVLGQRVVYALGSEARGRLNGLFMSIFFIGGAVGSALGGWAYAHGGWQLASLIGAALPLLAILYALTEKGSRAIEAKPAIN
ncbi:MFS transporter [Cohnella ginsengisoli]|uniref:MFS transporter n=1 Tax=Cohnella ginsengisoli TaxID=425004 RepID=A0A9X4KHY6_9BACL|nr:MFS transporter [Cohnella ginsengisoli]MDG0792151.1 MFS transporter [Cohnella ginsengisoli]